MKRAPVAAVCALGLGLSIACGADRNDATEEQKSVEGRSRPVEVTGCLTARGDQFVVTDLEREGQAPTTETYQLIGNEDELRPHVGKQVRIVGEADPQQVAEVREATPAAPAGGTTGTAGQAPGGQPKVSTETSTRMEVAKLRVQSVTPSGATCAAEAKDRTPPSPRQ